jgi:hypothetical protein
LACHDLVVADPGASQCLFLDRIPRGRRTSHFKLECQDEPWPSSCGDGPLDFGDLVTVNN